MEGEGEPDAKSRPIIESSAKQLKVSSELQSHKVGIESQKQQPINVEDLAVSLQAVPASSVNHRDPQSDGGDSSSYPPNTMHSQTHATSRPRLCSCQERFMVALSSF